jgi:hypothetical protein
MHLKRLLFVVAFLLSIYFSYAQKGKLNIGLSKQVLVVGDTLEIDADYTQDSAKVPPYTLQCIVENETGGTTKMRWPILNGQTTSQLLITDSLPKGHYKLYFAVQPRFFKIYGTVNEPKKQAMINSSLMTGNGKWLMEQLPVADDGSFLVKSVLFENNATVIFSKMVKKGGDFLDVSIKSFLDSTFEPVAVVTKEIVVGPIADTTIHERNTPSKQDSLKFQEASALPTVVVIGKKKTQGEVFNQTYSTGLFQDMNERVLSLLDDPSANSGGDIFQYLQGRVAGLQINNPYGGDPTAKMRGDNMYFYLDEIRVEGSVLSSIPISDIAIVKVYPPPFFGNPGGGGGGIGIYTRRGEYVQAGSGKHVFQVKGYTPIITKLMVK